jgi:hypothetical protein
LKNSYLINDSQLILSFLEKQVELLWVVIVQPYKTMVFIGSSFSRLFWVLLKQVYIPQQHNKYQHSYKNLIVNNLITKYIKVWDLRHERLFRLSLAIIIFCQDIVDSVVVHSVFFNKS